MSHFSVLVVTENPEQVEAALQPYHEYECTGTEDQYVRFVEEDTSDLQKEHREHLEKYPDSTKEDFGQFVQEWHGYEMKGGKWGRHTNPDAKWDWWKVGGRWSGFLKPKSDSVGVKGETGLMGSEFDPKGVDQCIKSGIDFDFRMKESAEKQP